MFQRLLQSLLLLLLVGAQSLHAQEDLQIVPSVTGRPLALLSDSESGQRWYQLVRDGAGPEAPIFAIMEISNIRPPGEPVEYDVTNIWVPNSWSRLYRPQQSGEVPYSALEQWKPISLPADTETMMRLQSISANGGTIVPGENLIISEDGMAYLDMQFLNFPTGWTPELEREGSLPLIAGRLASDSLLEDPPSYTELFMYQLSRGVGLSIAGKAFLPQSDLAQRGEFYQAESEAVTDYAVSSGEAAFFVAGGQLLSPAMAGLGRISGRGTTLLMESSMGRALGLPALGDRAMAIARWDVGKASFRGFSAVKGFTGTAINRFLPARLGGSAVNALQRSQAPQSVFDSVYDPRAPWSDDELINLMNVFYGKPRKGIDFKWTGKGLNRKLWLARPDGSFWKLPGNLVDKTFEVNGTPITAEVLHFMHRETGLPVYLFVNRSHFLRYSHYLYGKQHPAHGVFHTGNEKVERHIAIAIGTDSDLSFRQFLETFCHELRHARDYVLKGTTDEFTAYKASARVHQKLSRKYGGNVPKHLQSDQAILEYIYDGYPRARFNRALKASGVSFIDFALAWEERAAAGLTTPFNIDLLDLGGP